MGKENPGLLCDLLAARAELLKSLQGLREDTARKRPEPEEWSTVEVLQHVADIDQLMVLRFVEIQAGRPDLPKYDLADWEGARREAEREGLPGVLLRLGTARQEVLQAVSSLSQADLQKAGRHYRYGPMTTLQLVELLLRHDRDHAEQIAKTRATVEA